MSILRNKLDDAKRQHELLMYPGDLAAELLPIQIQVHSVKADRPLTSQRWFWAGSVGSAAAAALVVGMFIKTPARSPDGFGPAGVGGMGLEAAGFISSVEGSNAGRGGQIFYSPGLNLSPVPTGGNAAGPSDGRFKLVEYPVAPSERGQGFANPEVFSFQPDTNRKNNTNGPAGRNLDYTPAP